MARNLPEVLGEHRPHALQDEVAPLVRATATSLRQALIQLGHHTRSAARDCSVPVDENGLLARQEQQRVVAVGQLDELERGSRLAGEATGLPDLESMERAENHERRRRYPPPRIRRLAPVVERLLTMMAESFRLRRRLHLDDADPRPQEVEETALLPGLEGRARLAEIGPVADEQLVEEGLSPGALTAFVERPVGREAGQVRPDFLAGQRHRGSRSDGEALLIRDGVEGGLKQPAVVLAQALLALFERSHQVLLGTVSRERDTSPLRSLARLGDVEQNLLDFAVMGLVQHQMTPQTGHEQLYGSPGTA